MKDFSKQIIELRQIHEKNQLCINKAAENVADGAVKVLQMFKGQMPPRVETHILDMATHYQEQAKATIMQSENFTNAAVLNCKQAQEIVTLKERVEELEEQIKRFR